MMRRTLLLLSILLLGCQESLTTPSLQVDDAPVLSSEAAANAKLAIDDGLLRIVPVLGDADVASEIRSALTALRGTLIAERTTSALATAALAQIERYRETSAAHPAELDALRLAIATAIHAD